VSTAEELLGRKSNGSSLEGRENGLRIRCADHATHSISRKVLALTSRTSGRRSVGIIRLWPEVTEFSSVSFSYSEPEML
jgi:hypothetical protein